MGYKFKQGAVWRKWDLHVHTPASVLHSAFNGDWDEYVKTLFRKAIERKVSAIGITDYYLLDGYRKLVREYLSNDTKLHSLFSAAEVAEIRNILVIPNIEFRLSKLVVANTPDLHWNRKVNYHVILSDALAPEAIESEFINRLEFSFNADVGEKTEKRALTHANLREYGARLKTEHHKFASHDDLFVGMMNASVSEDDVARLLRDNSTFRGKYLLGLPQDEDLSDVHWNSQGHGIRKLLIRQAHFIFSSSSKTINFCLGKGEDPERFRREFGRKKACLWGSDAHSADRLFEPDEKRYTWIKADLTFDGLKQAVMEPELRVRIQENEPGEKAPYQLLAAARFLDRASPPRFSDEWIPINDDLTSIIGGKSSGKSLFLYCLAASANREEADTKASVADAATYRDIVGHETFDFEIKWGNGDVASLKKQEQQRPITYIPQLYINHLSEEQGREHLNALIRTILLQNRELATVWADTETDIESINGEISTLISQLFSLRKSYRDCSDTIKALGSKEAVTDRRNQLVSQIDDLRKKSGFTEDEERRYQALTRRIASLTSRKERLTAIVSAAEDVRKVARQKLDLYAQSVRVGLRQANVANDSLFVGAALDALDAAIFAALEGWEREIANRLVGVPSHINKIAAALEERGHELVPLQAKVTNRAYLDGLVKALDSENQKLKEIEEKERQQQLFRKQGEETSTSLLSKYALLHSKYLGLAEDTERRNSQLGGGITVAAKVTLERERFQTFFNSFDARGGFQKLFGEDAVDENGEYIFENGRHTERIRHMFDVAKSKEGMSRIRRNVTEEDVVRRLMSDCFSVTFGITYKGDDILVMSPGKRGLVLLSLILHLSDAKHPILVDQPEDNLDNRTIYEELCQFIRDKKVERQIITVTHNANLVVATDSDCVIVANQSGQQVDRDNRAYQFEYVGGALEDTFVDPSAPGVLFKSGIREHVCEILEGGRDAFIERERKYGFS